MAAIPASASRCAGTTSLASSSAFVSLMQRRTERESHCRKQSVTRRLKTFWSSWARSQIMNLSIRNQESLNRAIKQSTNKGCKEGRIKRKTKFSSFAYAGRGHCEQATKRRGGEIR